MLRWSGLVVSFAACIAAFWRANYLFGRIDEVNATIDPQRTHLDLLASTSPLTRHAAAQAAVSEERSQKAVLLVDLCDDRALVRDGVLSVTRVARCVSRADGEGRQQLVPERVEVGATWVPARRLPAA